VTAAAQPTVELTWCGYTVDAYQELDPVDGTRWFLCALDDGRLIEAPWYELFAGIPDHNRTPNPIACIAACIGIVAMFVWLLLEAFGVLSLRTLVGLP
jgi:hypothetical protein